MPACIWRFRVSVADLAQWEAVNFFDGLAQFRQVEQRALDLVGMALQPLIGAEPRAGRPASWPPTCFSSAAMCSTPLATMS